MNKFIPRVLLYSQDSLGLAHLRRNTNIAHELSRKFPGANFLFISDSPLAPFFKLPNNSKILRLPTLIKSDNFLYRINSIDQSIITDIVKIRSGTIREAFCKFSPDIFLVDHLPQGALCELTETLAYIRMNSPQMKTILGLRDIIGAPETIVSHWHSKDVYKTIAEYYDLVFIYGSKGIYDPVTKYKFPEILHKKIIYCNYVCNSFIRNPITNAQFNSMFTKQRPLKVLVEGGGGSDAHFFMNAILDAIGYLGNSNPFNTIIFTGLFMPSYQQRDLLRKSEGMPVVIKHMERDILGYLKHADLIVSMAGYNSVCEIIEFGKKSIIIPRSGSSEEQSIRAQIFENLGLVSTITTNEMEPKLLADRILQKLNEHNEFNSGKVPNLNGSNTNTNIILDLYYTNSIARKENLTQSHV